MQVTNLAYFYETARKVRGGKFVWVKDSNGELRNNVLLGGTIGNPNKGFGHLWAAQLMQYTPGEDVLIFRSFAVKSASGTTIYVNGDGFSDAPEVGQILMKAPDTVSETGQSGKVTAVVYDETNEQFVVTVDTSLGTLAEGDILVEAKGDEASASAEVLVPNPNIFNEADRDMLPTEGYGFSKGNYSVSGVFNKMAWIKRMQPLPQYVLDMNRSRIEGIFWI